METVFVLIVLAAGVIGVFSVILCLSQILDPHQSRDLGRRIRSRQFSIWQLMTTLVVAALLFHAYAAPPWERWFSLTLLSVGFLAWFVASWRKEFVFLMGLRDDELPGRHDKLIWVFLLAAAAPIGVWFFRSYRLAHWPEPKSVTHGEFGPEPAGAVTARPAWSRGS